MDQDDLRSAGDRPDPRTDRDRAAEDRDRNAEDRDQAAQTRDEQATGRDDRARAREDAAGVFDADALADRAEALRDRRAAARNRSRAADDRQAASGDRLLSAREREALWMDALTGAHRREVGIMELEREVARAKRTNQPLTLAFVDVDHLKATNDSLGHAAGDQRLRATANSIRTQLRSYDLLIRFGGDEFVCALFAVTVTQAAERFLHVKTDLAAQGASVTVGLAQLEARDTLDDLVARADKAMYEERQRQRSVAPERLSLGVARLEHD